MISLLPDDYVRRRSQHRANIVVLALFAIVMSGVIVAAILLDQSNRHTSQVSERISDSYREAAKLVSELKQLEAKRDTVLEKAELCASLLDKVPRSYLLAFVTNAMPEYAALTRFELSTVQAVKKERVAKRRARSTISAKPPGNTASDPPVTIIRAQITGLGATDVEVARFITNLAQNPITDSVDLVYSQQRRIDKTPVREFKVTLELKPTLHVAGRPRQSQGNVPGRRTP